MLERIKHRGENRIAFKNMPYSKENILIAKSIKGARWSASRKCWHFPDNKETEKELREKFKFILEKESKKEDNKLDKIINAFGKWMKQKRYSNNTVNSYISLIKLFFRSVKHKNINEITEKDIIRFNQSYILKNNYSISTQNQFTNAIKLFYQKYENRKLDIDNIERPRKERKLPDVFSKEEVKAIINNITNIKHKTLISLIYSAGLRIGEALNLELTDLDSKRKMLHIRSAKGKKDRFIPLSPKILQMIINYYRQYRPKKYLFEGQNGRQYTATSARMILKKAMKRAGINKPATLHTLRHSYATHLLENGTDIRLIQELLGHNSPKTTMIYTHVSTSNLALIENPFDKLDIL